MSSSQWNCWLPLCAEMVLENAIKVMESLWLSPVRRDGSARKAGVRTIIMVIPVRRDGLAAGICKLRGFVT